jgi:hypothetical protein
MTVFKKLQTARYELSQANVKKTGHNSFGGWKYYELGDFIPTIHKIFNSVGLCGVFTFGETATLTIYDTEDSSPIQFSTPIVYAESNKGQPIQLLGSTHSYLRRYLWLMAMEIVETDQVDSEQQEVKPEPIKIAPKKPPARIEGKEGPWYVKVEADPNVDMNTWLDLVTEAFRLALSQAQTERDVLDIFKFNKNIFDKLEKEAPDDFAALMANFKSAREAFKKGTT